MNNTNLPVSIQALVGYIKSKWLSVALFALGFIVYHFLPDSMPFLELYYTALTIQAVAVFGPLIRLQLWTEVAHYAETGGLLKDLAAGTQTLAFTHYWRATAISYALPLICMATIAK